jgi:hypothetical protein
VYDYDIDEQRMRIWEISSSDRYHINHAVLKLANREGYYLSPGNEDLITTMRHIEAGKRQSYQTFEAAFIAVKFLYD